MAHRGVEIALGRLITDESVRRAFQSDPIAALRDLMAQGVELSPVELTALKRLDPSEVDRFAKVLDSRLRKAVLAARQDVRDPR